MNTEIPALSIRQPWCWAILYLGKSVENRSWATHYRGRIRIHAAKTWDDEGEAFLIHLGLRVPNRCTIRDQGGLGAYVGEVNVVRCTVLHRLSSLDWHEKHDPWAFGPVCWELHAPEAYAEPIPARGYPGLYYPERLNRRQDPQEAKSAVGGVNTPPSGPEAP